MVQLVSLAFVKQALRIAEYDADGTVLPHDDDEVLAAYIEDVQEAVLRYLRVLGDNDWTGDSVPKAVRQSIVMGVKALYDPDQVDLLGGLASSDPKNPLVAMLCMMRRPTLA